MVDGWAHQLQLSLEVGEAWNQSLAAGGEDALVLLPPHVVEEDPLVLGAGRGGVVQAVRGRHEARIAKSLVRGE